MKPVSYVQNRGFTLIEVLLALVIIAISLTAVIKATTDNVNLLDRIRQKTIAHWVAYQGVTMVQSKLLPLTKQNRKTSQITEMLGQKWYWTMQLNPSKDPNLAEIVVSVSLAPTLPPIEILHAFLLLESPHA